MDPFYIILAIMAFALVAFGLTACLAVIVRVRGRTRRKEDFSPRTESQAKLVLSSLVVIGDLAPTIGKASVAISIFGVVSGLLLGLFPVSLLLLGGSFIWIGRVCRRQVKRMNAISAENLLMGDRRPPILYLRGFSSEESAFPFSFNEYFRTGPALLEEATISPLVALGPVVGLGNAKLRRRPSEYSEFYLGVEDWKSRVDELIQAAGIILVSASETPSLTWEIERIVFRSALARTLFVIPPKRNTETLKWLFGRLQVSEESDQAKIGGGCPLVVRVVGHRVYTYLEQKFTEDCYKAAVTAAVEDFRNNRFESRNDCGYCPNCKSYIPIASPECPHCAAAFGAGSAWSVVP